MKLNLAKNNPVDMVGDGKKPNRWWVTASSDFSYMHEEDGIWMTDYAEDLMKSHGIECQEFKTRAAVFSSAREAFEYAQQIAIEIPPKPSKGEIHTVRIEDRMSGECAQWELVAYPMKSEWASGWTFQLEDYTHDWFDEDIRKELAHDRV